MSQFTVNERTQIRVNAAQDMIDQCEDVFKVRFAAAYAIGYIDALHDERLISLDGAELYRQDAYTRRQERLAALGVAIDRDEP